MRIPILTRGIFLSKKIYSSFLSVFKVAVFLGFAVSASSQNNPGISFGFLKSNTHQSLEEVASNVLRLKNNTRQKQSLIVNISIPDGWQLISKTGEPLVLMPLDSVFIPVRIIPSKASKGSTHYIINAFLTAGNGFQLANDYWYVDIRKIVNWNVRVPRQKIYFTNGSDSAPFDLIIENSGNSDENIVMEFTPQRNLLLVDSAGIPVPAITSFHIKSGTDSLISCRVKKIKDSRPSLSVAEGEGGSGNEKYSLKVTAKNESSGTDKAKLWRGNLDFYELYSELKIEGHGYSCLPITFELNSFDVLGNTTLSLDIYGNAQFNKDRSLSYRYQTNYVDNFVDAEAYIGSYHYLGYFTRRGGIEFGNLSLGKQGAFIGGKGVKGTLVLKKNELSGMFLLNPTFRDHYQTGVGANNIFRTNKFINDTYFQRKWDQFANINSTFLGTSSTWQVTRGHAVKAALGTSHEDHYTNPASPLSLWGFGYEAGYSGSVKKMSFGVSHRYGTKKFTTYGGVLSFAASAGYSFNERYSLSAQFDYYGNERERYSGGIRQPAPPPTDRQRYELRFSANTNTAKLIVRPYYMYQNIFLLRTATKAVGFDYRPSAENDFKFYASLEGGFIRALDTGLTDFFFLQAFGNFKYRSVAVSVRYYFGPYQTIEQIRFIQTRVNPQKLVLSAYYDRWILKNRLQLQINSSFHYDSYFQRIGYILRPELFCYAGAGFKFSLYMEYLLNSQPDRSSNGAADFSGTRTVSHDFNFGAGIKKTFEIPLNRKKFHEVEITVFKDQNGNGMIDKNEGVVENIVVTIRSIQTLQEDSLDAEPEKAIRYELITGREGTVKFENLPTGTYTIHLFPLVETDGWFDGKEMTYIIDSKKKIAVPLMKAAKVTGTIALEMDKYSRFEGTVDLSRIRITATSAAGNTYTTLTGKNGEFSMFLPIGDYTINVNQSALGGSFEFVKSEAKITLNNPDASYSISFYVREKKRKMNIKEFKE